MKQLKQATALAALIAAFAAPASAGADPYIPPGNPAASQYTEGFPTSGGNVEVNSGIGDHSGGKSPTKVLGEKTAKALEQAGDEGRAVALLAVEGAAPTGEDEGSAAAGGKGNQGGNGGGKGQGPAGEPTGSGAAVAGNETAASASGSSGLGQVVSHATLSSSGEMGIFLPLVLLGGLLWAIVFVLRNRRQNDAPGV